MSAPLHDGVGRRPALLALLGLAGMAGAHAAAARGTAMNLDFRGTTYVHRWSRDAQHEFTPGDDADLKRWRNMLTLNEHAPVKSGEQLADLANRVLTNYQRHGKILQTRSKPRTATTPAEHLVVAVLGTPELLEAAFARCLLHEGSGLVVVASHRVYGSAVGPAMSDWLRANGQPVEQALLGWDRLPSRAALQRLPRA